MAVRPDPGDRVRAAPEQVGLLLADAAQATEVTGAAGPAGPADAGGAALGARGAPPTRRRGPRSPRTGHLDTPVLDGGQRHVVLDALITVLEGMYAHLPQKRAAYAVDPVQALRLLALRASGLTDAEFHLGVTGIVTSLRDAHTRYLGPAVDRAAVAVLPFLVESYGPPNAPVFLVSKTLGDPRVIPDPVFTAGVVLESWNGAPIARAVDVHADRETGGRPDARRARAVESLTARPLDSGPPPDEEWVVVGYRRSGGGYREVRLDWRVVRPRRTATAVRPDSPAALRLAVDPRAEAARRARKMLFAYGRWRSEDTPTIAARPAAAEPDVLATSLPDNLTARTVARGRYGHLRIWSFDVHDADAFVAEVRRLVALLPPRGLVLDIRGNPGGLVWAAERILQLFAPAGTHIMPTRFALLATPVTRAMAASDLNRMELGAWEPSLRDAVVTGEAWSRPLPLTDPDSCNDVGRRYPGPVVLVADASTYSAGDLFAAGFVDHRIGPMVIVGRATGAGGANVWTSAQVRDALSGTVYALPPLPGGASFTLAVRRAVRSAAGDGVPLEDLGVPGTPYALTRRDLTHGNTSLLRFATGLLGSVAG